MDTTTTTTDVALRIYGASDDLIELEGQIVEEFNVFLGDEPVLLGMSDGTLLRVVRPHGVWRFTEIRRGPRTMLFIDQCPEDHETRYSDEVYLTGAQISWVLCGTHLAKAKRQAATS